MEKLFLLQAKNDIINLSNDKLKKEGYYVFSD